MFLAEDWFKALEFERERLQPRAVIGPKRLRRDLVIRERARSRIESGLQNEELVE